MKDITPEAFPSFYKSAKKGTSFRAQIFSLTGGNVRINFKDKHPKWYIDPKDDSDFFFNFSIIGPKQVSISPLLSGTNKPVYSSVREDYKWQVHVKNPTTSKWITQVNYKESIEMYTEDLMMTTFKGFNSELIQRQHDLIISHRKKSPNKMVPNFNFQEPDENSTWFLSIAKGKSTSKRSIEKSLTENELRSVLKKRNLKLSSKEFEALLHTINTR